MSTNDVIEDSLTRHQIFVLRYGAGREKEAQKAIARSLGEVIKQIKELDLMGLPPQRLLEQSQYLYRYLIEANSEYVDEFMGEMRRFSKSEVNFNTNIMSGKVGSTFNVPSDMQLEQAVFGNFGNMEPAKGRNIQGLMDQFGVENADLVEQQIRDSILLGENTNDLVNKITNIEPLQKRKASTLARTVTNQVSNQTRTETMKANEDVLEGYEWVATLDSRTSIICASRDGNIYTNYDTDPKPPAHFNCRSTITFKVDPKYDLGKDLEGTRPAKGSGGKGDVDNDTNYDSWLRKQSPEFQDEVLGKGKAKIFRDGTPLSRFVDENGKPLSLKQLGELDTTFNGVPAGNLSKASVTTDPFSDFEIGSKFHATSGTVNEYRNNIISHSSSLTGAAIRKSVLPSIIDAKAGGTYTASTKIINCRIDRGDGLTLIHEYGHHIDSTIGRSNIDGKGVRLFRSESDALFIKAFEDDRKALNLHRTKLRNDVLEEVREEMADLVTTTRVGERTGKTYTSVKWTAKDKYYTQVMDIFDAMVQGHAYERMQFSGHGKAYYKNKGSRYSETFAQLFSLDGAPQEVKDKVLKWFPKSEARFRQIMEEYIESEVNTYDGY